MLLLAAVTFSASAAEVWFTSQVRQIYPLSDGTIVLTFAVDASARTSPATPERYYITAGQNGVGADGLRAMQATAMSAFAIGRRLSVAFDDATTDCYINRMVLRDQHRDPAPRLTEAHP